MDQEGLISRFWEPIYQALVSYKFLHDKWARNHRENLEEKPEIWNIEDCNTPNLSPNNPNGEV